MLFGRSEGVLGLGKSMLRNVLISNGIRGEVHLVKLLNHLIRGCIYLPRAGRESMANSWIRRSSPELVASRTEDGGRTWSELVTVVKRPEEN